MAGSSTYKRGGHLLQAVTANAAITSDPVFTNNVERISFHFVSSASGTRAGTIAVYCSNDKSNWVTVTADSGATSVTITASTLLNVMFTVSDVAWQWMRVVTTDTTGGTGTGTLDCYCLVVPR